MFTPEVKIKIGKCFFTLASDSEVKVSRTNHTSIRLNQKKFRRIRPMDFTISKTKTPMRKSNHRSLEHQSPTKRPAPFGYADALCIEFDCSWLSISCRTNALPQDVRASVDCRPAAKTNEQSNWNICNSCECHQHDFQFNGMAGAGKGRVWEKNATPAFWANCSRAQFA